MSRRKGEEKKGGERRKEASVFGIIRERKMMEAEACGLSQEQQYGPFLSDRHVRGRRWADTDITDMYMDTYMKSEIG